MSEKPVFILYSKPDCHLCDLAKRTIRPICAEFGVPLKEEDITLDPALQDRWGGEIPVGFLNGEKVFKYRVDPVRLRRLLRNSQKKAGSRPWRRFRSGVE